MQGFAREVWLARWIVVREWLIGAATALASVALWALFVWLCVMAVQASGLLPAARPES